MPRRALNGLTPYLLIANTDSNGTATFTIPAGRFTRYDGCVATPRGPATTRLSCQVTAEPAIGGNLWGAGGTVTVAVSQSNVITTLLLTLGAPGLIAAPAGVPVMLIVWGA